MTKSVVWLLRLMVAVAILPSLAGMATPQEYRLKDGPILEHPKEVIGLAFSPNGKMIATICRDRGPEDDIRVWDVESGEEKWKLPHQTSRIYLLGFADTNTLVFCRMKVDEASLAKSILETTLEVWDWTTNKVKRMINLPKRSGMAGMASGSSIVAIGGEPRDKPGVNLWDVTKGEKVGHLRQEKEPQEYAFTHDGKIMAVATKNGVHLWDMAARKEIVHIPLKSEPESIALRPDGKMLFVAWGTLDRIHLYDVPKGEFQYETTNKCFRQNCMGCSSDGKLLVTNELISLLETTAGKRKLIVDAHYAADIRYLVTSPQGNWIATAKNESKQVRLFKIEEKEP